MYRVSKTLLNKPRILPNVKQLGQWYIEYSNDYEPDMRNNEITCTLPDYPLWQHWWNGETQTLDNYSYNQDINPVNMLSPFTICKFYADGTENLEDFVREDTYVAPDTGTNLTCREAAVGISNILTNTLQEAAKERHDWQLYLTGGMDTCVLQSIIKRHSIQIATVDQTKNLEWPAVDFYKMCGPQQKFMMERSSEFMQLPPMAKNLVTGFMGGLEILRWPASIMALCKIHGTDYREAWAEALERDSYLAYFLHFRNNQFQWQTPDVSTLQDAKDYCSDVLIHTTEVFNVDDKNLLVPYRNRDIHHWVMALAPNELMKQAWDSQVHVEIIKLNAPELLSSVVTPKLNKAI